MKLELRKVVRFPKFLFRNFLMLWLVTCSFGLIAQTATAPTCPVATALSVSDISATGARINFSLTPNASAAVIEIYTSAAPNYLSKGSTTSNFFLLTGLTPATVYHYRIKSECTGGTPGYASGEFKTISAPVTTPVILTGKGKVKISTTGPCERLIILDNGNTINPVELLAGFLLKDGQYVEVAYELLKDGATNCTAGVPARISKISELVVIPEVCNLPIILVKNSTTPVSYTFKTSLQPDGSKFYWYFGDNGTSDAASPSHTYAAGGIFVVNLKVLDKNGKVCYGEMKETFLGGTVTTTTLTAKGKVKILAGSVCEKMIVLDNNTVVVPVESVAFTYKDGQYVEVAYEILKDRVISCKEGPAVKITRIAEIVVTPVTCPAATNVSVGEITATSARIKFTLSPNITSATLEYMSVSSPNWIVVQISKTSAYWDLKELTAATKYYYRIKTVCESGIPVSTPDTAYFETKAAVVCAAASNVTVSELTANSARINYKLPADVKAAAVEIREATANDWLSITVTSLTATYFDKKELKATTKYATRIKTICADGSLNYSPEVLFVTLGTTACPAAVITSVGELTATSARINFKLPAEAKAAVLGIIGGGSNNWITFPISSMTATYYDLKDLKAGSKYYYHLKTECATGSAVTPDSYFETKTAVVCAAASNVTVSELTVNSARINFKLPADVKGAFVEIRDANTNDWLSVTVTSITATYFDKKELRASTKYTARIKTVCADGSINYSPEVLFATLGTTACPAAVITSVGELTATSARINFKLPTEAKTAVLGVIASGANNWLSFPITSITATYYDLKELKAGTKYYYHLKTECVSGSTVTTDAYFETKAANGCAPASEVKVNEVTSTGARINYKLPLNIASATLELLTPNTSAWHARLIVPGSSYIDLNELVPQTRYYFRIRTICTSGSISYSPDTGFTTAGAKTADMGVGATTAPVSLDLAISCFPNPAKDILSVTIYGEGDQLIRVRLANVYGRAVFEGKFPLNTEQRINVQNYPRGIYVLKVSNSIKTNSIKILLK